LRWEAVRAPSGGRGRRLGSALAEAGVEAHLVATNATTARIVVRVEADGERSL
jgi:hypothetical protein